MRINKLLANRPKKEEEDRGEVIPVLQYLFPKLGGAISSCGTSVENPQGEDGGRKPTKKRSACLLKGVFLIMVYKSCEKLQNLVPYAEGSEKLRDKQLLGARVCTFRRTIIEILSLGLLQSV